MGKKRIDLGSRITGDLQIVSLIEIKRCILKGSKCPTNGRSVCCILMHALSSFAGSFVPFFQIPLLNEFMTLSLLYLLNKPSTRCFLRTGTELDVSSTTSMTVTEPFLHPCLLSFSSSLLWSLLNNGTHLHFLSGLCLLLFPKVMLRWFVLLQHCNSFSLSC